MYSQRVKTKRRYQDNMPTADEETSSDEECIKVIGNEILFYGDVNVENALTFVQKFKKLEVDLLKKKAELIGYEPQIRVHILSDGGDVFSGMNMMNILQSSRVKVITIAQGACCSAATFVFLGGSERRMGQNAYLLIHQISTEFWGKFQELRDEVKTSEQMMKTIKKLYMSKTSIPERKFKTLMRKDIFLPASKCLKYKIVHAVD
jgi:ATP-dependent protease ClpP protease subunit